MGNKCDLEENRAVTREEAEQFAFENDAPYFETSAKTGENVQRVFETLINKIIECLKQMESGGNASVVRSTMKTSIKLNSEPDRRKRK